MGGGPPPPPLVVDGALTVAPLAGFLTGVDPRLQLAVGAAGGRDWKGAKRGRHRLGESGVVRDDREVDRGEELMLGDGHAG